MSQKYEVTGKILLIGDTQTFGSGFQKREFVIEDDDPKYPQKIKLEAVKDGCVKLDSYQPGDGIAVTFDIRGNEYNGKHYVNLVAWKFERVGEPVGARSPEYGQPERSAKQNGAGPPATPPADDYQEDDDIPF